jgi:hypothetical protein
MYEAKTPEAYMQLLEQALFEVEDLIRCAQEEGDVDVELTNEVAQLNAIRAGLQQLAGSLASGAHEFGKDKELAFMTHVRRTTYLPFRPMLDALNSIYRKGFDKL